MAFTATAMIGTAYDQDALMRKLLVARKMVEVMWPGWYEFLDEKEKNGEIVNAHDS